MGNSHPHSPTPDMQADVSTAHSVVFAGSEHVNNVSNSYSEAIDVFYSEAIFKAFTPIDIDRIFLGIPPQRMDCVRSIWIDIRFAITCSLQCDGLEEIFDERTWVEAVRSFAKFPHLRDVRVSFLKDELTGGDYCAYLLERFVLPPLAALTNVPKYEFMVNFDVKGPENAPFRIKRIRPSMLR
ncbi:hypothetical protein PRK78_005942 [Emydomyces testavorans]|uniref:DUF7730 domain-containing protein n=1 Tax=Emydomyces testavorans TaxID=2070801 RepID=A0AAF0DN63_9EURO|nr:hypothetical protein PRK78_005942 [Emydomyces testavorans]